jgi:carotenoid cleavage dioxygenase
MNAPARINPYLAGNFAPLRSEDDFADLKITGEIPKGLTGSYYRNGPNPQFEPRDPNHHWFGGDGMVHAWHVNGGKVNYVNRYAKTPKYEFEHEAGKSMWGTFGNPMTSDPSVAGKESGGVANTNIVWHAGKLLALEEGHEPFEMDPVTLASRGYVEYAGPMKRFTAHPKMDPETGEMVFFGYGIGDMPFADGVAYGVVDKSGKVTRLDKFQAPFSAMVHDFLVTRNFAIFPILPLTGSLQRAMSGKPPFAWEPEKGSHVGVLARKDGIEKLRWFTTDACYVFHPMNAWDEGDKIYCDVMEYPVAPLFPMVDGSPPRNTSAKLVRWTIDLSDNSNTIKRTPLDDMAGEFPRLDERRAGLSYRHGYYAANTRDDGKVVFNAISHFDHKTGKRVDYQFADGDVPGEPVFVPRSANAPEGDGWLVATVYRGAEDKTDFAVFDATDITKGPIGLAHLPRRVPFGFHGNWRQA